MIALYTLGLVLAVVGVLVEERNHWRKEALCPNLDYRRPVRIHGITCYLATYDYDYQGYCQVYDRDFTDSFFAPRVEFRVRFVGLAERW